METIVYLQINDWSPFPKEARRLLNERFNWTGDDEVKKIYSAEELHKWVEDNKLCINSDMYDMSSQYWITTTKEWLTKNYPELLPDANEYPKDQVYIGDRKYFLKYIPENYGLQFVTEEWDAEETQKYIDGNRFVCMDLFKYKCKVDMQGKCDDEKICNCENCCNAMPIKEIKK